LRGHHSIRKQGQIFKPASDERRLNRFFFRHGRQVGRLEHIVDVEFEIAAKRRVVIAIIRDPTRQLEHLGQQIKMAPGLSVTADMNNDSQSSAQDKQKRKRGLLMALQNCARYFNLLGMPCLARGSCPAANACGGERTGPERPMDVAAHAMAKIAAWPR
jgi:hypothetical protein